MTSLRRGRILAMTLSLSVSFPALGVATAADRTIVASFASGDDFPTAYVLTFGGRSYRLDRKDPIAEIGYAGGRTRHRVPCRVPTGSGTGRVVAARSYRGELRPFTPNGRSSAPTSGC